MAARYPRYENLPAALNCCNNCLKGISHVEGDRADSLFLIFILGVVLFDAIVPEWVSLLFGLVGVTSIVGLLKLMGVFAELFPELVIEGVDNKIKDQNSESRVKVKNRGKLPAFNVVAEVFDLDFTIGSLRVDNSIVIDPPPVVPRVAGGESFEIPVTPGVQVEFGGKFSSFRCSVLISYEIDFFFVRWSRSKKWRFELKNVSEGFFWSWQII